MSTIVELVIYVVCIINLGIICFQNLEVLLVSKNIISDLIEIELCSNLEKLDLSSNKIEDEENLFFLSNLNNLKVLNLRDNPIFYNQRYKSLIDEYLPGLESLDRDTLINNHIQPDNIQEDFIEDKNQIEEPNENLNTLNKEPPNKNQILKPVIIKKVCDINNIVKQQIDNDKSLGEEIRYNLEKNKKVKIKIKNEIHKS
jgi:hypothetical protein